MAKKKDYNVIEMNDKSFTIAERTREDSDVRINWTETLRDKYNEMSKKGRIKPIYNV